MLKFTMKERYDIFQSISQRENGEMPQENESMVSVANYICRTVTDCRGDEAELERGFDNVADLNEAEKRCAEKWAKTHDSWIPIEDIYSLGVPGPTGSESETYFSSEGYVYKSNNLMVGTALLLHSASL